MSTQTKEIVLGDIVKWELPHEYCREERIVSRDLNGVAMAVGELCEPDAAVAQVHTFAALATAPLADGGTYRLGYKGQWTTAMAFNETLGNARTAFELLSTVTDVITFSAEPCITGTTATWTSTGNKAEIDVDARLLTDGGVSMAGATFPVTTEGTHVVSMVIVATGANVTGICLGKVTEAEIQTGNNIKRAFLVRGSSICDSDQITCLAAEKAAGLAAMVALGVQMRTEPTIYQSGPPTS